MHLFVFVASHAWAGEAEAAEHVRHREELVGLVQRAAWPGAEQAYRNLVALEAVGESLTYEELRLGAQVARQLGDMTACRARLDRAFAIAPTLEDATWLRELDAAYAPVTLVATTAGAAQLEAEAMPFEPDRRAAIQTAQVALARNGRFEGLLPRGAYRFGGRGFVVEPTVAAVVVDLTAPVAEPISARPGLGGRLAIAGAWTQSTAPSGDPQPPAFGGAGGRVAAGVEQPVSSVLGVYAEGGWHGLVDPAPDAPRDNALHLAFLSAGLAAHAGPVRVAAGGVIGAGALQATGLAGEAKGDVVWAGTVVTPGAQVGVAIEVAELGPLSLAVAAGGGGVLDPSRAWPWGQLGVELSPR
ncbi:MAG: hypothetical protein ACOZNI_20435 [Myxococcota bacterium]